MNSPRTFCELLDRYHRGERVFVGSELDQDPQADLGGICLDGLDLSKACVAASFQGASLRRARFVGANLKTCDFKSADLTDANFTGAALCATDFRGAKLDGVTFTGASFHSRVPRDGEKPDW